VRLLRGGLEWIAMKAGEKDRARRYGTPSEFAADIERYLENRCLGNGVLLREAGLACPPPEEKKHEGEA